MRALGFFAGLRYDLLKDANKGNEQLRSPNSIPESLSDSPRRNESNMKSLFSISLLMFCAPSLQANEFDSMPADLVQRLAPQLASQASKIENPQIKIEPDLNKANGVYFEGAAGLIIVPQSDLKESEELAAQFRTESGAALGYLFAFHLAPLVDGEPIKSDQLRSVNITDGSGAELYVMLLTVRQVSDDDYRLYVYGKGAEPIVDAPFSAAGAGDENGPATVKIDDVDEQRRQGQARITVFGKYQASFGAAYVE